ncbi:hypothetical protein M9H77_17393 [Catharanthus roseus]|uniref:Uncharacterized protein n=1 Tax=Catharanthus roseus TaxID=4058 RepID=A0ACC0B4F7_CATRO|nr:hypothetical protein M9H77_17393 [Catharanthus roseus]
MRPRGDSTSQASVNDSGYFKVSTTPTQQHLYDAGSGSARSIDGKHRNIRRSGPLDYSSSRKVKHAEGSSSASTGPSPLPRTSLGRCGFSRGWTEWQPLSTGRTQERVRDLWNLEHGCEIIDIEHGYAVVRFYSKEDYLHVLEEGPWIVMGHHLTVSRWRPNFRPSVDVFTSRLAWIRLPEILVELFQEELLMQMGNKVGKAVLINQTTLSVTRGRVTRLCA